MDNFEYKRAVLSQLRQTELDIAQLNGKEHIPGYADQKRIHEGRQDRLKANLRRVNTLIGE